LISPAYSANIVERANAIEWTAANSTRLQGLFKNAVAVADFENRMLAPEDRDEDAPQNVGEFKLIDLNNDGHLELVCTVDVTGRAFYTTVIVFSRYHGKIVMSQASTHGANMVDLEARFVDLNKDGKQEILVPRLLEQYAGADMVAHFTDVYTFQNGTLIQSDHQFLDYYRNQRLPVLTEKLDQLLSETTVGQPANASKEIRALQKEVDAINVLVK
jgi:hypothetical protein